MLCYTNGQLSSTHIQIHVNYVSPLYFYKENDKDSNVYYSCFGSGNSQEKQSTCNAMKRHHNSQSDRLRVKRQREQSARRTNSINLRTEVLSQILVRISGH